MSTDNPCCNSVKFDPSTNRWNPLFMHQLASTVGSIDRTSTVYGLCYSQSYPKYSIGLLTRWPLTWFDNQSYFVPFKMLRLRLQWRWHLNILPLVVFFAVLKRHWISIQFNKVVRPISFMHQLNILVLTDLVNKSATFLTMSTFSSKTLPFSIISLMKWYCTSMCFIFYNKLGSFLGILHSGNHNST